MIDNSYLLALFGQNATGLGGLSSAGTAATAGAKKKQPTPPWDPKAVVPQADSLVRAALAGRKIIDEGAAKLDLSGASADYKRLFALYQGLETLNALVNRGSTRGVSSTELSLLNKRFASGLSEIQSYLSTTAFEGVRMVAGVSTATSKSSAAVARDSARSVTGPIHEGSPDDPVSAFQGDVVFDITLKRLEDEVPVHIDLSDMGATPRSLTNVLSFINGKLEAAGVETRLGREQIKAEPKTVTVGGKTVTLPAGADQWALVIRGDSSETVRFSAPTVSDAAYVVQGYGTAGGEQMLKFSADDAGATRVGETQWVEGRLSQTGLPAGIETVRASAAAPDGGIWIVADLTAGPDTQPIKGQSDVALIKLDSAGRVVQTRTLGAASTASGYAIAVDADGRVAVAGSVTGALDGGHSGDVANVADSFVSVFDAQGQELWTQRRGARAEDEATAVVFGPNGTVQVAGRAKSSMPGAVGIGGWDGYLQTFSETQEHIYAPVVATATGTQQFGTAGDDTVQAMTVDGSNLYTAGVEDGRLVVRQFTLDADGKPTLASTRDLGLVSGGAAGISVADGRVIVTGTTRNPNLDVAVQTNAHAGGQDAFVVSLSSDLMAGPQDRVTYVGGAGDDTAADVKVVNGKVWITGVADRAEGAKPTDPTRGYLVRMDAATGAVEWRQDWAGDGEQARPLTLAVAAGGASVLDRLGLPQGDIVQKDSKRLVDATALRVGDRFQVSAPGGRAVTVTIEARDTLQTLARKIEQASGMKLKVTVSSQADDGVQAGDLASIAGGFQRLTITSRDGKTGAVLSAGEGGRDALAALGLSAGYVGPSGDKALQSFGLNLSQSLNLSSPAAIKSAGEALQAAMKAVRDAYRSLAPKSATSAASGTVPAYLTNQLANYQAALARLTG
ncbi:MAG: transcriptional regulator [Brevundimonas sp.]|uniref:transcriptional regulator n=1 Tax=Brevundimonas sp. TaxID=1871086 RepID=UPI0025C4F175|nr:transcriptional regulator [Brevundimonas sp.]MBX3477822.1 transcriptional regulator [Brevundimonas sp.]